MHGPFHIVMCLLHIVLYLVHHCIHDVVFVHGLRILAWAVLLLDSDGIITLVARRIDSIWLFQDLFVGGLIDDLEGCGCHY